MCVQVCACIGVTSFEHEITLMVCSTNAHFPQFLVDLLLSFKQDLRVGGQKEDGKGQGGGRGVKTSQQEHDGVGLDLVVGHS